MTEEEEKVNEGELEQRGKLGREISQKEVNKAIDKLKTPGDVWHTDQIGGACWNAYLQIQGTNFGEVKEFSEKVLRLMKRRGCTLYELNVGA